MAETTTVLIVDDHAMFAEGMARLLADEPDLEVVGTLGGPEGVVDAVVSRRPDVVLLDQVLPGRPGVEVAVDVKARRPETMVVMLTGAADDRVLLAAIDAGCSGFLTKDRVAAEVATAVRAAAAGEVLIPPTLLARLLPQLHRSRHGLGSDLTPREREVLELLATGAPNRAIADQLFLSVNTVRNHVQQVLSKLQAHSKLEAVATAVREGIIRYPG